MAEPFFPTPARSEIRFENRVSARIVAMSDAERAAFVAAAAEMVSITGLDGSLANLKRAEAILWGDEDQVIEHADKLETWLAVAAERLEDEE